jgi:hypothetical protein
MKTQNIEQIADSAINVAFKYMQDQLGVAYGDYAGIFMCGKREDDLRALFVQYMNEELRENQL